MSHWSTPDEEQLKGLLSEACDFHIYSALDLKQKFSEILSLDYIPYEIRLIEKLRDRHGLANVKIDHPLLATALAEIPDNRPEWDLGRDRIYQFLVMKETRARAS